MATTWRGRGRVDSGPNERTQRAALVAGHAQLQHRRRHEQTRQSLAIEKAEMERTAEAGHHPSPALSSSSSSPERELGLEREVAELELQQASLRAAIQNSRGMLTVRRAQLARLLQQQQQQPGGGRVSREAALGASREAPRLAPPAHEMATYRSEEKEGKEAPPQSLEVDFLDRLSAEAAVHAALSPVAPPELTSPPLSAAESVQANGAPELPSHRRARDSSGDGGSDDDDDDDDDDDSAWLPKAPSPGKPGGPALSSDRAWRSMSDLPLTGERAT
jgi:hypothetical protein